MYTVSTNDQCVQVTCGNQSRRWFPSEAKIRALYLSRGADIAVIQGGAVNPSRYAMPGSASLTPFAAYALSQQIFDEASALHLAARLEPDNGEADVSLGSLVEEADSPTVVVRFAE